MTDDQAREAVRVADEAIAHARAILDAADALLLEVRCRRVVDRLVRELDGEPA